MAPCYLTATDRAFGEVTARPGRCADWVSALVLTAAEPAFSATAAGMDKATRSGRDDIQPARQEPVIQRQHLRSSPSREAACLQDSFSTSKARLILQATQPNFEEDSSAKSCIARFSEAVIVFLENKQLLIVLRAFRSGRTVRGRPGGIRACEGPPWTDLNDLSDVELHVQGDCLENRVVGLPDGRRTNRRTGYTGA